MGLNTDRPENSEPKPGFSVSHEPIAIVGIGCRLPGGANDPQSFWKLLCEGVDAVGDIPSDRWNIDAYFHPNPIAPGKMYTRWGGFIDQVGQFDPNFFGISPREATKMDPQQRLLLEVAYEALEDAGIPLERVSGTNTGVFVGISTVDYASIQITKEQRNSIDAYTNLGSGSSIAANRISYLFDLRGPSFAVDTACSSSLVAIHLACRSLHSGESSMALVGGVNLILRPENHIGFSKAQMLSPDGRCKSFDAAANGYVRSEGAAVVVLKPLSKAQQDGDPIYALIRGSTVNQDGKTNGIALPNPVAQEDMLRQAYAQWGLPADKLRYVEAHGTGTPVGDPIEVNAIGRALRSGEDLEECWIGSVKSNIGHLEAASGMAGLIKTALAIKHAQIPGNLHLHNPNPDIPFAQYKLRIPTGLRPWPIDRDGQRHFLSGVNSFGFGGTNAHVILDAPPKMVEAIPLPDRPSPMVLSAAQPEALLDLADRYVQQASSTAVDLSVLAANSCLHRTHHAHRLVLVPESLEMLSEHLEAFKLGETRPGLSTGYVPARPITQMTWVFSGMGPQWWGMGRRLLSEEPVYRDWIERCDALLAPYTGWSLLEELQKDEQSTRIQRADVAQPALFSLQVALAELLRSWGLEADCIVGHSLGEVAAAYVAGVFTLKDAVKLVFHRSRLQQRTAGMGRMLAVGLSINEARALVLGREDQVSIAAINSPTDITLSGDGEVLEKISQELNAKGAYNSFLRVEVAYHSPMMEPLKQEFLESVQDLRPRAARIPLISTALGYAVRGDELGAAYWWKNLRDPVLFASAMEVICSVGQAHFLEIGAHPVLSSAIGRCLQDFIAQHPERAELNQALVLNTLRREENDRVQLLGSLGRLFTAGFPIDWKPHFGSMYRRVELPKYPWQRERYWNESLDAERERIGGFEHPLLGNRQMGPAMAWNGSIDLARLAYLNDHGVQGSVVFPAAAYVEMALQAGSERYLGDTWQVGELNIQAPLVLGEVHPVSVQTQLEEESLRIFAQHWGSSDWEPVVEGRLIKGGWMPQTPLDIQQLKQTLRFQNTAQSYLVFSDLGLQYGPHFQPLRQIWTGKGVALGFLELAPGLETGGYHVHPTLLDGCFQLVLSAMGSVADPLEGSLFLPVAVQGVRFRASPQSGCFAYAEINQFSSNTLKASLRLVGEDGEDYLTIEALTCRRVQQVRDRLDGLLYRSSWQVLGPSAGMRLGAGISDLLAKAPPPPVPMVEQFEADANLLARRWMDPSNQDLSGEELWKSMWDKYPGLQDELLLLQQASAPTSESMPGLRRRFVQLAQGSLNRNLNQQMAQLLRQLKERGFGQRALEVGLETAGPSEWFKATGSLDFAHRDPELLEQVRENPNLGIEAVYTLGEGGVLEPSPESGYDLILLTATSSDIPNPLLARLFELLLPGGVLLIHRPQRQPAWYRALQDRLGFKHSEGISQQTLLALGFREIQNLLPDLHGLHGLILAQKPQVSFAPAVSPGRWLYLGDDELGTQLEEALAPFAQVLLRVRNGERLELAPGLLQVRPGDANDLQQILTTLDPATLRGVIFAPSESDADLAQAQQEGCLRLLQLVQLKPALSVPLWLITQGIQDATPQIEQSGLWGMGRVIRLEYPETRCRMVDLQPQPKSEDLAQLVGLLLGSPSEDELALRHGRVLAHRIQPISLDHLGLIPTSDTPFEISIAQPGVLSSLQAQVCERRAPGTGEIELEVHAAALNFKDIMIAMGMLPDEALEGGFTGRDFGMECAGVVVKVAEGVEGFAVGDRVLACTPRALSRYCTIRPEFAVRIPDHLSFEEASTIPVAFLTAYYALEILARVRKGERVLIHAATGGVGLAAVQLAHWAGAEVFATAGTPEKRALLKALGVQHVMDSRKLDFAEQIKQITAGRGVDVVLNTLAGEAIQRSLEVLSPYGRFVEIGKRDIYENHSLGLKPFRNNLSYFALDLDRMYVDRAAEVRQALMQLMEMFERRALHPLSHRVFSIAEVSEAFRYMAQARHIGKVVLRLDHPPSRLMPKRAFSADPQGTYLITGGLGGFGLELARWLVEQGARHLELVGRSGARSPQAVEVVEELRSAGVEVGIHRVDVSDAAQLEALLNQIRQREVPLRGVFHAAMVLDDALMGQLDAERFRKVMYPKLLGGWNLHRLTMQDSLQHFVLFSSVVSLIGNIGQAPYAAANAFLDTLSHYRREKGLPSLSVNWGAVGDAGYLAQAPEVVRQLENMGVKPLPVRRLLQSLGELLCRDVAQLMVAQVDWGLLGRNNPAAAFRHLVSKPSQSGEERGGSWLETLRQSDSMTRLALIQTQLTENLARILGTSPSRLDPEKPIMKMGIDSLMAVEIGSKIQAEIGVRVPPMKFMEGISLRGLAGFVAEQFQGETSAPLDTLEAQVTAMSDEEVEAMLAQLEPEGGPDVGR